MAAADYAFGFLPYGPVLRARYYGVVTAPAIHYFHGDIVGTHTNHVLTPMGYLPGVKSGAVIDGVDNLLGTVLGIYDEDLHPISFIDKSRVGNEVIAGVLLIADHPEQQYVAREDFAGDAIDKLTEASMNADIESVTDNAGHEDKGVSKQMIDSSTIAESKALQLKLYGPHPNDEDLFGDDTPGTSLSEGCRFICKINEHYHNMTGVDGGASYSH